MVLVVFWKQVVDSWVHQRVYLHVENQFASSQGEKYLPRAGICHGNVSKLLEAVCMLKS